MEEPVKAATEAVRHGPAEPGVQLEITPAQDSAPAVASAAACSSAATAEQQPYPGSQTSVQASSEVSSVLQQAQDASDGSEDADEVGDEVSELLSMLLLGHGALLPSAQPAQERSTAVAASDRAAPATAQQQPRWLEEACSSSRAEEQRALRGFVKECCEAGAGSKQWDGSAPAAHAQGAQQHAADSSSPFLPGSRAQWLYVRMGSSPTAAALLRGLLCPFTKVSYLCPAV